MYVCMGMWVFVYMCAGMLMRVCACVCMCVFMPVCVYTYMRVLFMCVHACVQCMLFVHVCKAQNSGGVKPW